MKPALSMPFGPLKHFPIPEQALACHTAALGKTGSGKTSSVKAIVEQVATNGFRVCVLDTIKSDWWGITSSADGKRPGLPFTILGGPRGHLPLHSNAGAAIGQLVGSGQLPLSVLDMADFEAGGLQRFFCDFAPALMRSAKGVLYLVIEEAHELAPKERAGFGAENMAIHWAKKLATAGRSKGIRLIVCTQRTQALHNAVLGSCDTLIAHRLVSPADQEPVLKWLQSQVANKSSRDEIAQTLAGLPTGTAWVCAAEAEMMQRVKMPLFRTYDNTATPTGDADSEHAVTTAAVDQEQLRTIIGDAVKEAEANDPKRMKLEIAKLKKELAAKPAEAPAVDVGGQIHQALLVRDGAWMKAVDRFRELAARTLDTLTFMVPSPHDGPARNFPALKPMTGPTIDGAVHWTKADSAKMSKQIVRAITVGDSKLSKAERLILTALAQYHPKPRTKVQVATLTGYAHTGGGFCNALSSLKTAGLMTGSGDSFEITETGFHALGDFDPLPTGGALLNHWLGQLSKAERSVLEVVADEWPNHLTKEQIAAQAGYASDGGGFNNALSRLRTLELIKGRQEISASADLMDSP